METGGFMLNPKIGVATSIFSEKQFDPFETIAFCKKHAVKNIQLYLDRELEDSAKKIEHLAKECQEANLTVFCHSPYFLNKEILNGQHIASLCRIFPKHQPRYTVIHFDERITLKENLSTIEELNNLGITVCLENFYIGKTRETLIENFNKYATLYSVAMNNTIDLIPVIDFPRLFIDQFKRIDGTFLTELLLHKIALHKGELILHLIDTLTPRQSREDWTYLGNGIIPYRHIFSAIKKYDLSITAAILEFEAASLATESFAPLTDFLS
jgi:sugar phosphate isomerase/epimerase